MILGILGGMGPEATYDLLKKIIDSTDAQRDQDHLHIIIDNNPKIPDRTSHISGQGEDPSGEMTRSIMRLEFAGADYIAIACHTAHYYFDEITRFTRAQPIHMIEELAKYLVAKLPGTRAREALLLATEGTYQAGIYPRIFKDYGLEIIEPEDLDKKKLMKWIYGIKSGKLNIAREDFEELVYQYIGDHDTPVLLGCTELPILLDRLAIREEKYIDPTLVLAQKCIELAREANGVLEGNLI